MPPRSALKESGNVLIDTFRCPPSFETREAAALQANVTDDSLAVDLEDGRTITVPLAWFPRLANGRPSERTNLRLIAKGTGIHWPELDEDISVASLLVGRRSGESQASLRRWLGTRQASR